MSVWPEELKEITAERPEQLVRSSPNSLSEQCFTHSCAEMIGRYEGDALGELTDRYIMRNYVGFASGLNRTISCIFGNVTVRFFVYDGTIKEMKLSLSETIGAEQ